MTFESIIRSRRLREDVRAGLLAPHIDGFVSAMARIGYTSQSFHDLVLGAAQFARYLKARGVTDPKELCDRQVENYVRTLPVYRCGNGYLMSSTRGSRAAHHLVRYLRTSGATPPEPVTEPVYGRLLDEWLTFLRQHRGLAPESVSLYRRTVEPFLQALGDGARPERFAALSPVQVRDYLQHQGPRLARVTRKNLVVTLRGFLRFAYSAGHLYRDVAVTIQRVPYFTLDRLPRGPRWEDLPRLLETADRSTAVGRRDYTILLSLITYGVRAGQLANLQLEDVHWREGLITFPAAKKGRCIEVPLTPGVGNALLRYLRDGRPVSSARQVFLSLDAPFRPLQPKGICGVVVRAFQRSGIPSPHRGSHAIRHAWATRALAQGQRLKTIADLLGHRCLESTRIYTKVDYQQLQSVGLPWPDEEARS